MSVEFRSQTLWSEFLDPREDFAPSKARTETRFHPLTGHATRVAHIGMPPRETYAVPEEVASASIPIFAPPMVTQITPQYRPEDLPEGRYKRGKSVLFPNLNPYDLFSPVIAIGDQPLAEPHKLDPTDITDALILARTFFTDLDAAVHVGVVGWNFWPAAGSSIPPPHFQAVASGRLPDRQARELDGENRHIEATGSPYWPDFVEAERNGPRWIGEEGGWSAITEFAPRTVVPETVLVHEAEGDLQRATDDALAGLGVWLARLATAHAGLGVPAFNVIIHPTAPLDGPPSPLRARFIPRVYIMEKTHSADMVWVQLGLEEGLTSIVPEEWAQELRQTL